MMEEEIMFKVNDNYQKLPGSYLFSTIAKKVKWEMLLLFTDMHQIWVMSS